MSTFNDMGQVKSTDIDRAKKERAFGLEWTVANAIGFGIGGALAGAMILAGELATGIGAAPPTPSTPVLEWVVTLAAISAVAFGVTGAVIGVTQWFVLRRKLAGARWWAPATTFGGALFGAVSGAIGGAIFVARANVGLVGFAAAVIVGIPAVGLPHGVLQWLVLKRQVEGAGRWVRVHFVSFYVANGLAFPVMGMVATLMGWSLPSAQAWGLGGAVAGTIYGAMTGPRLVELLRQSAEKLTREVLTTT